MHGNVSCLLPPHLCQGYYWLVPLLHDRVVLVVMSCLGQFSGYLLTFVTGWLFSDVVYTMPLICNPFSCVYVIKRCSHHLSNEYRMEFPINALP